MVYQRRNGSFCVPGGKNSPQLDLSFQETMIIDRNILNPNYKNRVDYVEWRKSWCLHNLSEEDIGIYEFAVIKNHKKDTTYYQLVVEGKCACNPN